jgi:general secretion pathway protein K
MSQAARIPQCSPQVTPRIAIRRSRRYPTLSSRDAQQGIALVIALWITILLTVIASSFAFSMRSEALAARNAISLAQARAIADGAVERAAFELMRPRIPDAWAVDGQVHAWQDGDIAIVVTAVDESAKIDLNMAPDTLLKSALINVGGLEDDAAARVLDAIGDWRDPDDFRRPNGAEEADYRAAGLKYGPANAQFETVGELGRVLGVTPELYARIAPLFTVYSRQPGVNPATAERLVLLALPNATPETVDSFIEQRTAALAAKLPVPPFPAAQAFGSGPVPVWRIHAEATLPDGVTFAREAVFRPSGDPQRPLIALAWLEASRVPTPLPAAADATAATTPKGPGSFLSTMPQSLFGNNARRP